MRESIWQRLTASDRANIERFWARGPGAKIGRLVLDFGLSLIVCPLPRGQSGYLEFDPTCGSTSGFKIVVNALHAAARQRFTAGHELGHYLLHRRDDFFGSQWVTRRSEESGTFYLQEDLVEEEEAHAFSRGILMQTSHFDLDALHLGVGLADLAKKYGVSKEAARLRQSELRQRHR